MSDIVVCTRCNSRFHQGVKIDRPLCGICSPRYPEVNWKLIPKRDKGTLSEE